MNYHNISYPDMNNGDGLRVVLWLSGCSHHCYNCQNPQTWDIYSGILFDESAKEELFRELDKDYISGLTLSGGDPLNNANISDVLDLVKEIRLSFPNKTIWLYTGYTWEDIIYSRMPHIPKQKAKDFLNWNQRKEIVSKCDILVDGRYVDSKRDVSLKWRGSSNQRVIDIKKSLQENKVVLYCD